MKKFYTFIVLFLLITCINCKLFSQEKSYIANRLSFKLSASMNYLDHLSHYENISNTGQRGIWGLNVRSGVEFKINQRLSLSSSLIFNQKGGEVRPWWSFCGVGLSEIPKRFTGRFYYMGLLVSAKYYALKIGRFNLFIEGGPSYNVGLDDHAGMKKGVIDLFASVGSEIKLCNRSFLMLSPTFITGLENYLKKDPFSFDKPYRPYSAGFEIGLRRTLM